MVTKRILLQLIDSLGDEVTDLEDKIKELEYNLEGKTQCLGEEMLDLEEELRALKSKNRTKKK